MKGGRRRGKLSTFFSRGSFFKGNLALSNAGSQSSLSLFCHSVGFRRFSTGAIPANLPSHSVTNAFALLGETLSLTGSPSPSPGFFAICHSMSEKYHFFNAAYSATSISPLRNPRISSSTHSFHFFPSGISLAKTVAIGLSVASKADSGMNGSCEMR